MFCELAHCRKIVVSLKIIVRYILRSFVNLAPEFYGLDSPYSDPRGKVNGQF